MSDMGKFKDITGHRFGRLTAISVDAEMRFKRFRWLCNCDCGKQVVVDGNALRTASTKSCGCLSSDVTAERNYRHGNYGTAEYRTWAHILSRCTNPNVPEYSRYGGRGITVCERWKHFPNFLEDMGLRPESKMSIERKNNNGNYEPSNCVWATRTEQANNKRSNRILTAWGITGTLAQWSRYVYICESTIRTRLSRKWSIEEALTP